MTFWICVQAGADESLPDKILFDRDIRPIFSNTCFKCHGPDANKRKAKLRMDVREDATAAHKDGTPIVPGDLAKSEVARRISATDPEDLMPPPASNLKLSARDVGLIKRWIQQGAEYQQHWSYVAPKRVTPPRVKNAKWVVNPVDAFILQQLEAKGITPSPEADKRTLLRRLSLDLIGLPPTPEDVAAFVKDTSQKAYERQVDRLLASPHFGERMAVPWLDVVRFADTVGYHGDQNMNVFPYRDYVIDAFNKNKPFDQFTIEQLAGDLLPNPTPEQLTATCFNRLNMMTREGGAQPKEYLAKYQGDRIRTVAMAWLGSTMGCCECHDHKFDPFLTKDFYAMEAFFADIRQWGVYQDYGYTPNPDLRGWSNDHPFPPEIQVDNPYLKLRMEKLHKRVTIISSEAANKFKTDARQLHAFGLWSQSSREFLRQTPDGWATPKVIGDAAQTNVAINPDGRVEFSGKPDAETKIQLQLSAGTVAAMRLELLPTPTHKGSILRGGAKNTTIVLSATWKTEKGKETKLAFSYADADHKEERYVNGSNSTPILGIRDMWMASKDHQVRQTGIWLLKTPLTVNEGDTLTISLGKNSVGCARVSVSPFASIDPLHANPAQPLARAIDLDEVQDRMKRDAFLDEIYLLSTAWDSEAFAECKNLQKDYAECRNGKGTTQIVVAQKPMTTHVLPRGNWQDESGEIVDPSPPQFLLQIKSPPLQHSTTPSRLDLAKWIVSPDNPLTSRTVMNRLWKQFFGNGISAVVDDLGAQGEWPSHPELLDWLAVEFRESKWDMKHMVKLIVMSATYRQDSRPRPELREADPNNRLLASQNPRRLEAELVRDNALFIAGLLNEDVGGPSVHPYQPAGYYGQLQFPNREYQPDKDDRLYRRGIYTHWQRTFLHPMLANFDAPSREECTAIRSVSNTPQQALTLLNDPEFTEAARVFAQKIITSKAKTDDVRLDLIFETALARSAKTKEKESLKKFLGEQRDYFRAHGDDADKLIHIGNAPAREKTDAAELAAWTLVCRVVLNLQETITRY